MDDGSSDASFRRTEDVVSELRARGARIQLLRNATRLGFARAQNQAIGVARGEHVCLIRDEAEIPAGSEGWLRGLTWLAEAQRAATAAPVTVQRDGRIHCAGAFGPGAHHLREEPDSPELFSSPRATEWNDAACLLTRRSYFEEFGLLADSDRPEHEWCARVSAKTGLAHWVHPVRVRFYAEEARRDPAPPFAATKETRIPASIVIVAYDGLRFTRAAIDAVLAHTTPPYEFVLVDNGSRDGTLPYFRELRDRLGGSIAVQVIENPENRGYPIAANQGARAARGHSVVFLNNDTEVREGWLDALLAAERGRARVGLVAPKVLNLDGSVQNAGGILHHPDGTFTIPNASEDRLAPPVTVAREIENAGGPCLLATRELLDTCGLFDEGFSPAYFEDSDLSLRAREAGFVLLYEPGSEVFHHGKATASVVASESAGGLWKQFQENERTFRTRWRSQLDRDDAARRRRETSTRRKRILLCYGASSTTTAAYAEAALRREHDVVTAGPGQELDLGDITASELLTTAGGTVDLLLVIEGENYFPRELEAASCPTAFWAIDNHLHASSDDGWHFRAARAFDHVFIAQRDYGGALRARGIDATWLPLACDPLVHRRHSVKRDLDIVFVGHVRPDVHRRRRALLDRLARRFNVHEAQSVFRDRMASLFSRAKVVFNASVAGDLNMRVFEALATGSLLVTDRISNGLETLFADGEHLALYDDENLEDVVTRYLEDAAAREAIGRRAERLVTLHHTYGHRMRTLVDRACSARPARLAAQGVTR